MYTPLQGLEVCLDWPSTASEPSKRALSFAATVAAAQGAKVHAGLDCKTLEYAFYVQPTGRIEAPVAWAEQDVSTRVILTAGLIDPNLSNGVAQVALSTDALDSEATLFAASGLADLNGTPEGLPLVPDAHYAAHTIGYSVYSAMVGVHGIGARFGRAEQAQVDGLSVLKWINWKAIAAGATGQLVTRTGALAEWPVLECKDGHVAILFTERDWRSMQQMVGDPALADRRFDTFEGRETHREEYLPILQEFCFAHSKAELREMMARHEIPGDSVRSISDLLECELCDHRQSFVPVGPAKHPRLPERVLAQSGPAQVSSARMVEGQLPLSGFRVLDLGIITAGAGVSAVLADMGAEVLKIESATYPDPFRQWAGSSASPLFQFNNRNKFGLDIDLKTAEGKAQFLELVAGADVVVENFRRGVMERLGLDFETLSNVNPSILMVSISGQGPDGPGTQTSTFGSTLEANAGYAGLTRGADGQPYVTGRVLNFPDQVICLYGSGLAAAAVLQCRRTGVGRHLDISQRDAVLYQIGDVLDWVSQGHSETPDELRAGIGLPTFDSIVTCADGVHVAVHQPDGVSRDPILDGAGALSEWVAARESAEVVSQLTAVGFAATLALQGADIAGEKALFSKGIFARDPDGSVVKGFPFQFNGTPMRIGSAAPRVGQHNAAFLTKEPA